MAIFIVRNDEKLLDIRSLNGIDIRSQNGGNNMAKETRNAQEVEKETVDTQESTQETEEKLLTQEEVNRLIAQNKSKAKEEARKELEKEMREQLEAEVEEAKRLAKLNDDERREEEFKKLQQELEEFKRKDAYNGLAREASKMLSEHSIQSTEGILRFVVKDTAEETQDAVNEFVKLVNAKVEEGVKEALSGKTPKVYSGNPPITKEKIMEIQDTSERLKAIQENAHLFK